MIAFYSIPTMANSGIILPLSDNSYIMLCKSTVYYITSQSNFTGYTTAIGLQIDLKIKFQNCIQNRLNFTITSQVNLKITNPLLTEI